MSKPNFRNPFAAYDKVDAPATAPRVYFNRPGKLRGRVNAYKWATREDTGQEYAVLELEVMDPGTTDHTAGELVSWAKAHGKNQFNAREIKGMVAAVLGLPFEACTSELMLESFSNAEALVGTVLDVTVTEKTTERGTFHNAFFKHVSPPA